MASVIAYLLDDQAAVRVEVDMGTDVTVAQVGRRDPRGTSVLRAGNKVQLVHGQAILFDYEAPLDLPCSFWAQQVEPAGPGYAESAQVTIESHGITWLKHPAKPSRNLRLRWVERIDTLTQPARAGIFPIIGRSAPIVASARRGSLTGTLVFHTFDHEDLDRIDGIITDGFPLLLQTPADAGFGSLYIAVGDVSEERRSPLRAELTRRWTFPFVVVDRPYGVAEGGLGVRWLDVKQAYATWRALRDSGKTWGDLLEGVP